VRSTASPKAAGPARKRPEIGDHRATHRLVAEPGVQFRGTRLGSGADPDEDRDQDEDRIAHEAEEAEADRDGLADRGGDPGGTDPVHAHRQQRAQHAAPVHREGRDHVEDRENQIGRQHVREEATPNDVEVEERPGPPCDLDQQEERRRDGDVHGRAGEGHDHLLPRILGHRFEHCEAADRQERDVLRPDAVPPGGQRVAEFVQDDADEKRQDEQDAADHPCDGPGFRPEDQTEIDNEEQERGMDIDVDASEGSEPCRPFHGCALPRPSRSLRA
jgi:hypothetical protein